MIFYYPAKELWKLTLFETSRICLLVLVSFLVRHSTSSHPILARSGPSLSLALVRLLTVAKLAQHNHSGPDENSQQTEEKQFDRTGGELFDWICAKGNYYEG